MINNFAVKIQPVEHVPPYKADVAGDIMGKKGGVMAAYTTPQMW